MILKLPTLVTAALVLAAGTTPAYGLPARYQRRQTTPSPPAPAPPAPVPTPSSSTSVSSTSVATTTSSPTPTPLPTNPGAPQGVLAVPPVSVTTSTATFTTTVIVTLTASPSPTPSGLAPPPAANATAPQALVDAGANPGGGKLVVAHHIVGNTAAYKLEDWADDIKQAKTAGIDGFALNIGPDPFNDAQVSNACVALYPSPSSFQYEY
jgi:hypothetical protein